MATKTSVGGGTRRGNDRLGRGIGRNTQQLAQDGAEGLRPAGQRPREARPLRHQFLDEAVECGLRHMPRDIGERRSQQRIGAAPRRFQHRIARLGQRLGGVALVHQLEMRRGPRFEREAAQQRLAEGVDRLDLHAAGRIEDAREEPARPADKVLAGHVAEQRLQVLRELSVAIDRPFRQALEQPVGHFGSGRAREGEAEDARGIAAAQHQRQHAVGQNLGLAGAGRCRDPDRRGTVGGVALCSGGVGAHHGSLSPAADHSLTRARCP